MKFRFNESCKIDGSEYYIPEIITKWTDNSIEACIYDYIVLGKEIKNISKDYNIQKKNIENLLKENGFNRGRDADFSVAKDDKANYCYLTLLPRETVHILLCRYIDEQYKSKTFRMWLNDNTVILNEMYKDMGYTSDRPKMIGAPSMMGTHTSIVCGLDISREDYINNKVVIHYKSDLYRANIIGKSNIDLDKDIIIGGNACRIIMDCLNCNMDYNNYNRGKFKNAILLMRGKEKK